MARRRAARARRAPLLSAAVRIGRLQRDWDQLGREDPLWAVLSDPAKRGRRWDVEEFFAYGREEIAGALEVARRLHPALATGSALDFGCGVGRLSQALAAHFDTVTGIDIAPSMIEQAREHAARAGVGNCTFVLNDRDDLSVLDDGSVDFVYSRIVLQHIPPPYAERYIGEFVRVLRPGGLALFQVPADPPQERTALFRARQRLKATFTLESKMQLYPVPPERVHEVVRAAGGTVVDQTTDDSLPGWTSYRYAVTRP